MTGCYRKNLNKYTETIRVNEQIVSVYLFTDLFIRSIWISDINLIQSIVFCYICIWKWFAGIRGLRSNNPYLQLYFVVEVMMGTPIVSSPETIEFSMRSFLAVCSLCTR